MAHVWLLGQWSLEKSLGQTLGLLIASGMLVLFSFLLFKGGLKLFQKLWVRTLVYCYVLIIAFLGILSFTGLIQYLLPVKLFLIVIYSILKWKFFPKKSK